MRGCPVNVPNVNPHLLRDIDEACARAKSLADLIADSGVDYVTIECGELLVTVKHMRRRTGVPNCHIYRHPSTQADADVVHEVEHVSAPLTEPEAAA